MVLQNSKLLCDIDMLLTAAPDEAATSALAYSTVRASLTGTGRIVYYRTINQQFAEVVALVEGQFTKGQLQGFGRIIKPDGTGCSV